MRIIMDLMRNYYGSRMVGADSLTDSDGEPLTAENGKPVKAVMFDFARLANPNISLDVSIGAASYWSEITQDTYIDNLFKMGVITDALDYLKYKSDKNLPMKAKIIEDIKRSRRQMQQQQAGAYQIPDLPEDTGLPSAEAAMSGLQQKVAQTPGALQ